MGTDRSGNYPPPPFWPDRLTGAEGLILSADLNLALIETDDVVHVYIADGAPGPCIVFFVGKVFAGWWPKLTIGQAELFARKS